MHELLSILGYRVNERREFFNCSRIIVEHLFALIDGTDVCVSSMQTTAIVRNFAINVVKLESLGGCAPTEGTIPEFYKKNICRNVHK